MNSYGMLRSLAIKATVRVEVVNGDPYSLNDMVNAEGDFGCGCLALALRAATPSM
jgi:hypothetical protein